MLWTVFLCASIVFQSTEGLHSSITPDLPTNTTTPLPLRLNIQAVPDYPVSEGQVVALSCLIDSGRGEGVTSWLWLQSEVHDVQRNWTEVGSGVELRLSRPEQSGYYKCSTKNPWGVFTSNNKHLVIIVSTLENALGVLGVAGFVLSVLALILGVFWLVWQKFSTSHTSTNISTGLPHTPKATEVSPPGDSDDVYMNYSCSNQDYTNLDPSTTTNDGVYSSFP